MKLTQEQFRHELEKMVNSPAWAELSVWFTEVMVRRVLRAQQPIAEGVKAAGDIAGAAALMLAIQNEVSSHGDTTTTRRAAVPARTDRQRGSGNTAGASGAAADQA